MPQDTLKNLLPKFIQNLKDKNRSPSTILAYRADLEQLVDYLTGKNKVMPDLVESTDVEGFRDQLLSQKYTPKSVSRKLNAVKTFFRFLMDEKITSRDPSSPVSHPKIEASTPKFLSAIEYRALRDVVRNDTRVAAIVELILQTGLRISEVAALKKENIKNATVHVDAYATQASRDIPLNSSAKLTLEKYLNERPKSDSPYIFVSKNGKPLAIRNIRAAIDRYFQKAEIPGYTVNDLRTTFVVQNLKTGVDLVFLSQVSGHKRLSTTERYLTLAEITQPGKKQELVEL
ncbi:MAG: Tyrosine recombinase XerC [Candidatus Woesebacteria bacterium GW2011_GWA1_39_21]|uniref:Tyrosine recombinase XerC n=1 Tax=Candidatus Woesebacteria bacterium GW2011_GWA1_39_21 TaxID=1618550 RepID=A0A0G0RDW0_9BACT|nr:MAG: Tyrosine recombinase XerC [Candidatus Woesebacteria bacterium GW2011_GWA1_39_21]